MNAKEFLIVGMIAVVFLGGIIVGHSIEPKGPCTGLQVIDCGHIVHNGDTIRFTTLPVK